MSRRSAAAIAALSALGATAWELQRRRDRRAIAADPEWLELSRPLRGRELTVRSADGTRLHVEVFGNDEAPTIVLIHGWLEAIRFWHYQIRDLATEFRVVAYDLRGHGSSEAPRDGGYTDTALSDDLQAVLDACLDNGQRCVVAGHSMGAMTIVAWAGNHPVAVRRRLAAAALINTGMSEMLDRVAILGPRAGRRVHVAVLPRPFLSPLRLSTMIEPLSFRVVRRITLARGTSPGRVAFFHQLLLSNAPAVRAGFGRLLMGLDLMPAVKHLVVPTVVIAGEKDLLLPPAHSKQLVAALPDVVEYVELPGIAHMAPIEAPDEVTTRLVRLARSYETQQEAAMAR